MPLNNIEQIKEFILEVSNDFELETNVEDVEDVCKVHDILDYYNDEFKRYSGVPVYEKALKDMVHYMEYLEEKNYRETHKQA